MILVVGHVLRHVSTSLSCRDCVHPNGRAMMIARAGLLRTALLVFVFVSFGFAFGALVLLCCKRVAFLQSRCRNHAVSVTFFGLGSHGPIQISRDTNYARPVSQFHLRVSGETHQW